ncbi:MAG: hemerythrin domain-containing protein [Candidatus Eisenbacteria bacterium]|uniref:Hemerythrin domain-containing protein n=1 Tax=Eiseniibacteriota bacterium TaxID=2212470 RepID=A0A9D6L6F5_UNCEI|nr:hemerythrin domain-containing protein [Candidatus Eisenbacteria bacterium]
MDPGHVFDRMRGDHQRGLEGLATLEQAVAGVDSAGRLDDGAREAMRAVVRVLEGQFDTHMAAEDEVLFPALTRALPHALGQIQQLGAEHEELRSMLGSLGRLLDSPHGRVSDEQVVVQARDLVDLLRIHIRKEESAVFGVAERVLEPRMLEALADRMSSGTATPADRAPRGPSKGLKP